MVYVGARKHGTICSKHPELNGERRCCGSKGRWAGLKWRCTACHLEQERRRDRRRDHIRRAKWLGAHLPLTAAEHLRISALYAEAARRTAETGIPHHVDHDVPIALGGKHHPDNLLVVPADMNLAKGARYASTWDFISS